jgi:hypothetical protein
MPAGQAVRSGIRNSGVGDLGRRKAGLADERRACATQPQHYQGTSGGGFLFSKKNSKEKSASVQKFEPTRNLIGSSSVIP